MKFAVFALLATASAIKIRNDPAPAATTAAAGTAAANGAAANNANAAAAHSQTAPACPARAEGETDAAFAARCPSSLTTPAPATGAAAATPAAGTAANANANAAAAHWLQWTSLFI